MLSFLRLLGILSEMELKKIYHPEIPAEQISESNSWKPSYGAITSRLWPRICTSKKDLWKTVSWRCRKVRLWVSTAGLATNWHLCAGGPCPVDIQLKSSRGELLFLVQREDLSFGSELASLHQLSGYLDWKMVKAIAAGLFLYSRKRSQSSLWTVVLIPPNLCLLPAWW